MNRLKLGLTVNLMLHAAAIAALHIAGKDARILTACYWLLLTVRLLIETVEGVKRK